MYLAKTNKINEVTAQHIPGALWEARMAPAIGQQTAPFGSRLSAHGRERGRQRLKPFLPQIPLLSPLTDTGGFVCA